MPQYDMCPVCTKPFEKGDVIADYRVWPSLLPRTAHFRCLMVLSTPDEKSKNLKGTTPEI
jgi:hypothetical protein